MASVEQIKKIIQTVAPVIQRYAHKYGYKVCSPAIGQVLQESLRKGTDQEGLSTLAYKYHNYHGIKCGKTWLEAGKPSVNMKTFEVYNGQTQNIYDYFRVFSSLEEGIEGYYSFLSSKRYAEVKNCVTPRAYMEELKRAGYATDDNYVNNVLKWVNSYHLEKYDDINYQPEPIKYEVGKTYTLLNNLFIRSEPMGSKMKYSCITQNAQEHATFDESGQAILKKDTRVTCKGVEVLTNSTWILIPSGWICAIEGGKVMIR